MVKKVESGSKINIGIAQSLTSATASKSLGNQQFHPNNSPRVQGTKSQASTPYSDLSYHPSHTCGKIHHGFFS